MVFFPPLDNQHLPGGRKDSRPETGCRQAVAALGQLWPLLRERGATGRCEGYPGEGDRGALCQGVCFFYCVFS